MTIKNIFDEIAAESGDKAKVAILSKYQDNELLKRVLYMANSKRVKFYLKQIPEYTCDGNSTYTLNESLDMLQKIADREYTGHDAINFLKEILCTSTKDDAYIIERIIEKDCKIGMGTTFMNKVFKDLIEDTPYMGAISFDEKKARAIFAKGKKGFSQIKMDGRYCNAIIRGGEVELESRSGETTHVAGAAFLSELALMDDVVLNGELTMDGVPRYESNGMIASIIDICGKRESRTEKENEKKLAAFEEKHGSFEKALASIRYTVWDCITVDEYFAKKSKTSYRQRLNNLRGILFGNESATNMVSMIESREVSSYSEAMEHFQEIIATEVDGVPLEGTILKSEDGEWKDGKPTWQIKMKLEMDVDLVIVGFNYGTKGTKNENVISSLNCESSDGLLKTRPQGIKEEMMVYITENQDNLMGKVVQVKCNGVSHDKDGNYSLMYPAFVEVRDDKHTCNTLEEIKQIENMAKSLASV
jgi:ATP-dependent DNA ligase